MDSSKSRKALVATVGLEKAKVEKTLYCWSYGQASHARKDCPSKQRQAQTVGNPKWKPIVSAKDLMKRPGNHLSKQLRCSHCERNNHAVENFSALYLEKHHFSEREKILEAKIGTLKKMFKSLASSS